MKYLFLLTILTIITFAVSPLTAQLPTLQHGIDLYDAGKYSESVKALELASRNKDFENNPSLWSSLGLAYLKNDEIKKARKASEKSVKLQPQNAAYRINLSYVYLMNRQINKSQDEAKKALEIDPKQSFAYYLVGTGHLWEGDLVSAASYAEKILAIDVTYPQAYMLKSDVLMEQLGARLAKGQTVKEEIDLLKQSLDVLENGVKNSSKGPDLKMLEEKLEGMKAFYNYYNKERSIPPVSPLVPDPTVTPVKILNKPRAPYTDNARAAGKSGTVRLAILLGANGKIHHILKLKGIGYGLDEQALKAARQITFEPKMKEGKPVSSILILEYSFSVY